MCQPQHREKKKREHVRVRLYAYCRQVKGRKFQARIWLSAVGSLNLGLFRSEWQVGQVIKAFVHRYQPGADLCDVLDGLRRDAIVPQHVLAKYVVRVPGESTFLAKVKKYGKAIQLGPFATEREAHLAMLAHLAHLEAARVTVPIHGPRSPYLSTRAATKQLGIAEAVFLKDWAAVFTNPLACRRVLFKDEVEVALQAGGGADPMAAKEAVVLFRMGLGRLDRHPVGKEFERCRTTAPKQCTAISAVA